MWGSNLQRECKKRREKENYIGRERRGRERYAMGDGEFAMLWRKVMQGYVAQLLYTEMAHMEKMDAVGWRSIESR